MKADLSKLDVNTILQDYSDCETKRTAWKHQWEIIADNVFPRHESYYNKSLYGPQTKNVTTKHGVIGPSCSATVGMIHKIVSQLYALLVDPTTEWLGLDVDDSIQLPDGLVIPFGKVDFIKNWVVELRKALLKEMRDPRNDFYPSSYQHIFNLFTIGTACREIVLDRKGRVKCSSVPMSSICLGSDGYGEIDRVFRKFELTNKEAYDLWGEGVLNQDVVANVVGGQSFFKDKSRKVYIEYTGNTPHEIFDDNMPVAPYMSFVMDEAKRKCVYYSMHTTFPYVVSRFDVASGEVYGKTFVWDCLPDILTINKLSKLALEKADWITNPPLLVQNATSLAFKQLGPRAIVQGLDMQGKPTVAPLQGISGDISLLMEYYKIKLSELSEGLVANDPLTPEVPGMTATEVTQRKIQSANRIRPMLVRFESEDLCLTVRRLLNLLDQLGRVPRFPYAKAAELLTQMIGQEVSEQALVALMPDPIFQLNIRFTGQMAKMQRMQELQDIHTIVQAGMQLAQVDSSVLDLVDLGEIYRYMIDSYGVSEEGINDRETVRKIREQKAANHQREALAQAAQMSLIEAQREKALAEADAIRNG